MRRNNFKLTEKHFLKAIRLTETLRGRFRRKNFGWRLLASKLDSYEELAKIYLKENKIQKAFVLIEIARSRVLAETLGDDSAISTNRISKRLREKFENQREELNWFYNRLNRSDAEKSNFCSAKPRSAKNKSPS